MAMNARKRQRDVITRMLSLNTATDASGMGMSMGTLAADDTKSTSDWQGTWKVLIYDKYCQGIIAPLLGVTELRNKFGITLHLMINQPRERVPDVVAIYFVRPTPENLDLIAQDLGRGLYDQSYLNFSSSLPRELLEKLATKAIASDSVTRIAKVYDQYTEFVCLESQLLTLNHHNSYMALGGSHSEDTIMAYIDRVVDGLFSVVATMAVVPMIQCRRGEAAEMVGTKLHAKLTSHLAGRANLFSTSTSTAASAAYQSRPVLILLDRNLDLSVPLHHPWTYQALLNDLLGFDAGWISLPASEEEGKKVAAGATVRYALDSKDKFWRQHAGNLFSVVAAAVDDLVKDYQAAKNDVTAKSVAHRDITAQSTDGALAEAISALPEIKAKKAALDMHTNIATTALKAIRARDIDAYCTIEQDMLKQAALDKKQFLQFIGPTGKGCVTDKLRSLLIYYLTTENVTDTDMKEYLDAIQESAAPRPPATSASSIDGKSDSKAPIVSSPATPAAATTATATSPAVDLAALKYLKEWKMLHKMSMDPHAATGGRPGAKTGGRSFFDSVLTAVGTHGSGLMSQVRTFLPAERDLPVTKAVELIMNNREGSELDKFLCLDPKGAKKPSGRDATAAKKVAQPYREAMVFMIGGGNYAEFQNLQDWAKKSPAPNQRTVAYGCTELQSPDDFLAQLTALGRGDATTPPKPSSATSSSAARSAEIVH